MKLRVLTPPGSRFGEARRSRRVASKGVASTSLKSPPRLRWAVRPLAASERLVGKRSAQLARRAGANFEASTVAARCLRAQSSNRSIERMPQGLRPCVPAHVKR
jgi:hypothetical protein